MITYRRRLLCLAGVLLLAGHSAVSASVIYLYDFPLIRVQGWRPIKQTRSPAERPLAILRGRMSAHLRVHFLTVITDIKVEADNVAINGQVAAVPEIPVPAPHCFATCLRRFRGEEKAST